MERIVSQAPDSLADPQAPSQPRAFYRAAEERHGATVDRLEATMRRVEAARLITFVAGSVLGLLRNDVPVPSIFPATLSLALLSLFAVLVVRHRTLRRRLRRERAAHALARAGLLRIDRDWQGLADLWGALGECDPLLLPEAAREGSHPYAQDLDLFGPASCRALLGPTPSVTGSETLRRWLTAPASIGEVRRRQGAVRSLSSDPDGRTEMAIEGLLIERVDPEEWDAFRAWLDGPSPFGSGLPEWSIAFARMAPPVTAGLAIAYAVGGGFSSWIWITPLVAQLAFAWRWGRALTPGFLLASARSPGLRRHHPLFARWERYESGDPEVERLRTRLASPAGARASEEIRRLERWLDAADSRASMFHFVLAALTLWDVHVAAGLERWKRRAGAGAADWFEALGELEALAALATLAHDQPEWCFPELREGDAVFEADHLGHPLLSDGERKTSSVRLDPPGRFLLVTGSNMSGKSTLLRSIGLAAVLGQAGSVVCASRAVMTPLRTFTSMRIHDSLTGGVSLFMAELLRLKALVDAADEGSEEGEPALLYLIDEVLQGTNSEERRVAARRIITHLLSSNAIGAVTTHDLALHEDPTLDPASSKVHFRETVGEAGSDVLSFDYVLRPGLATSRNALKLLRLVGLDAEGGGGEA